MVKIKDTQFCEKFENENKKGQKCFDLLERGFEPRIFEQIEFWGRLDLSSPGFLELLDFKPCNLSHCITSFHIDRSRCVGDWTFIVEQCVSKLSAKKQQRKGGLLKKQSMHFPGKRHIWLFRLIFYIVKACNSFHSINESFIYSSQPLILLWV